MLEVKLLNYITSKGAINKLDMMNGVCVGDVRMKVYHQIFYTMSITVLRLCVCLDHMALI